MYRATVSDLCICLISSRMMHADRRSLQNAVRNILDGELLSKYLHLSTMERSDLAKKIGTTQDIVSAPSLNEEFTSRSSGLVKVLQLSSSVKYYEVFKREVRHQVVTF